MDHCGGYLCGFACICECECEWCTESDPLAGRGVERLVATWQRMARRTGTGR